MNEYKTYKEVLGEDSLTQWHTYATADDKTHAFVVKGLDHKPEPQEIADELQKDHNIKVKSVHVMNTRFRPLYLVITTADHKFSTIQKIKYLKNVEVFWERRKQTKTIIQCKRCCGWGHATSQCHRQQKCGRCGEDHQTIGCKKDIHCANCAGNHLASSTQCQVYIYKVQKIQEKQQKSGTAKNYVPAPTPKVNVWETRRQNRLREWPSDNNVSVSSVNSQNEYIRETQDPTPRQSSNYASGQVNQVSELCTVINNFKKAINISELTRFLRDYTVALNNCTHNNEKVAVVLQYIEKSDEYKF